MTKQGFKALEIYGKARYFTMTGDTLDGSKEIREVDLSTFRFNGNTSEPPMDNKTDTPLAITSDKVDRILKEITKGEDGQKFAGYYYQKDLSAFDGDQSRADLDHVRIIANQVGFDPALIDQIVRSSAMMRAKWDEKHSTDGKTYGEMTIEKILQGRNIHKIHEIEDYLAYNYQFRYNEVIGKTEVL
ncbi:MAG: hypothetical protein MK198_06755 [Gracilimonas sp.]|uniref:phage NrS-1 polymerase family protein n=1 Tax=Gracilimonas sp. TaxID=1974203 RepID=UPI0037534C46|nr:hypothetical protein [Gracilimonas sp.]